MSDTTSSFYRSNNATVNSYYFEISFNKKPRYIIFSKIETIANLDFETSDIWSGKLIYELKNLDEEIIKISKDIEIKEKMLKKLKVDFEASDLFEQEKKLIDKYFLNRKK